MLGFGSDAVEDVEVGLADLQLSDALCPGADMGDGGPPAESDAKADSGAEFDPRDALDAPGPGALDASDGVDPGAPFGSIEGSCGVMAAELGDEESSFFAATIDFAADPFDDPEDVDRLTPGSRSVLEAGNAGGSSLYSEVFAFEVLARCDAAELLETETTISYQPGYTSSITDFLIAIDDHRVGVSVTRAVGFPARSRTPSTGQGSS